MLLPSWYFRLIFSCRRRDFLAHGQIPLLDLGIHLKVCTIRVRSAVSVYQLTMFFSLVLIWKKKEITETHEDKWIFVLKFTILLIVSLVEKREKKKRGIIFPYFALFLTSVVHHVTLHR